VSLSIGQGYDARFVLNLSLNGYGYEARFGRRLRRSFEHDRFTTHVTGFVTD
jgi:hypothetical protein